MTLADTLRRAEKLYGDNVAIIDGDRQFTYRELAERCQRLAAGLRNLGVRPGDRVATLMVNGYRYLEAYFAVPGMGAILVPLNNRHSVAEHRYIVEDCGVQTLIVDENFAKVADELAPFVERIVHVPIEFDELIAGSSPTTLGGGVRESDLAGLFYTGGTTGAAKGVMLTHRNLVANALHTILALGYTSDDTYLHLAPMFHLGDGASSFAITWIGGRHAFVPSFEPELLMRVIEESRTTVVMLVPTMIHGLISHPALSSADLSSLRMILHGAAPISEDLLSQAIGKLPCTFTQAYGMTEAAPILTALHREEELVGDERIRSAGREVVGVEVRVVRPDGTSCAPREVGEIVARGPNMTSGYWNKPDETALALRDGWYWSGDLAYVDERGYLYLVDRAKDLIITGGENVYSIEVEKAVAAHPAISDCAVIGVPDDQWGERVHVVVVFRAGQDTSLEDLRAFCAERIARYKCPKSMEVLEALPRSAAGKVLKRELRQSHAAGR